MSALVLLAATYLLSLKIARSFPLFRDNDLRDVVRAPLRENCPNREFGHFSRSALASIFRTIVKSR